MPELPLALTFDDVLLVPRRSRIRSRADVSTRTQLTRRIALEIPVVSANMDLKVIRTPGGRRVRTPASSCSVCAKAPLKSC